MDVSRRLAPHPVQHRTSRNSLQRHGDSYVTGSAFQQEHDPCDTSQRFSRQHRTKTSLKKHLYNGKTTCNGTNKTTDHYLNETKAARPQHLQLSATTATIQLDQDVIMEYYCWTSAFMRMQAQQQATKRQHQWTVERHTKDTRAKGKEAKAKARAKEKAARATTTITSTTAKAKEAKKQ